MLGTNEVKKIVAYTNQAYLTYKEAIKDKTLEEVIAFFKKQTLSLKEEIKTIIKNDRSNSTLEVKEQKALHMVMPRAYGLVKMASEYINHETHFNVQIMGAVALNEGFVAEMGTGEGKTLTATMPAYLNALLGYGVHIVTPNNYLATRDFKKMKKVYSLLGLTCGLVEEGPYDISTIEKKRDAYRCDITYGSSSAYAFDYLFDSLEPEKDRLLQRDGKPYFAIIDEADAVLFDDARVPFTISGTQIDQKLAITPTEKKEEKKALIEALKATRLFQGHVKKLRNREYDDISSGENKEEYEKLDKTVAVIINETTNEHLITTYGFATLFCHYKYEKIAKILKEENLSSLTMDEVIAYVMSEESPELTRLFDKFCGSELMTNYDAISKGIMSWYILERGKDYIMKKNQNNQLILSPVINGRTIDKRRYSHGLQQALEIKEKILNPLERIVPTKISDNLASIPTSSFFGRYQKLSGMTGTSIVLPLQEMYGLYTYQVPPNRLRLAIDRGDVFFSSSSAKFDAIFNEVLSSHLKGQPVLIATTSISKSIALQEYLVNRLKKEGIEVEIPVLNANIQEIEKESAIIAKAGEPSAITISTEMAGRGTDIKLGGEEPTYEQTKREIIKGYIDKKEEELGRKFTLVEKRAFADRLLENQIIQQSIIAANKNQCQRHQEKKAQVIDAGGLKIIGSGHFKFTRIDNQVKGRCGRQGDVGEIIFFNDPSDLAELGVPRPKVEMLGRIATENPYTEKAKSRLSIGSLIRNQQRLAEDMQYIQIKSEHEFEKRIKEYREAMYEESINVKKEDNYLEYLEKYIIEITRRIIDISSAKGQLSDETLIDNAKIDCEKLSDLCLKVLGVSVDESVVYSCLDVGELKNSIISAAFDRLQEMREKSYHTATDEEIKKRVDQTLLRIWKNFEVLVENIKEQCTTSTIAKVGTASNVRDYIGIAFDYCLETEIVNLLGSILNINYGKKGKYLERLSSIQITPTEITTIPYLDEEDIEEEELTSKNRR